MLIKIKHIYINCIIFWYFLALLSYIIAIEWWIRDSICVLLLFCMFFTDRKSTINCKLKFFILIFITVLGISIGLAKYNNYINCLITIRCIFIYPLIIWLGQRLYKMNCNLDNIITITNFFVLIIFIIGVIEELVPNIFNKYIIYLNSGYTSINLGRSGIGFGLGSVFGARQIFAMWLCVGIVLLLNNKFTFSKNKKIQLLFKYLLITLYYIFLFFTLSRTAILTSFAILIYYLFDLIKKNLFNFIISLFILIGFFFVTLNNSDIIQKSILMLSKSVKHMDFGMSGRLDYWKSVIGIKINILPNLVPIGVSKYFKESMGTADSSYIRLLMAYGLLIFSVIIIILIFYLVDIVRFKGNKKFLFCLIVLLGVSSVAIDMTAFFPMLIPIYLLIGYEYEKNKNFNNKNYLKVKK